MSQMLTIHVLGFGELYQETLNAIAGFIRQDSLSSLLRLTALMGMMMSSIGYLKARNPFCYAQWFLAYVLIVNVAILPKTSVMVYDISAQDAHVVEHVPVVFATLASLITTVGVGLAETYDALFSMPDDLTYTKTGSLFGAKMILAAREFRIIHPQLKVDMNAYFRNCVVGDIQINHKYPVADLSTHLHIWNLISQQPSKIRMTQIAGLPMSCFAATPKLKTLLEAEIKSAYTLFGIQLFGHPRQTTYEKLFETHLISSFNYYQNMTDTASDIFLQSMMINAISDGISHYQAFTDATAGVLNHQVSKSELQHRWSWAIAGQKAAWFLPLLHSLLTLLLFGLFPIILVMATLPKGSAIVRGYLQFFVSLQFWPLLFAILNMAMTLYGASLSRKYGGLCLLNIEKLDELHSDLSGVAGYLMLLIPFLAKGLVSNLSDAFNNLATSMSSHLQGSAMAVANEAAAASFSLGQTSFYNTSANNYSANKHDSNWSHLHGMQTEQFATGTTKTTTASGATVFDASLAMSKSALSLHNAHALSDSLNRAQESAEQTTSAESMHYQTSISNFAHRAIQLSQLQGHDKRLGGGVSTSESSQYSQALSTLSHLAHEASSRLGVSQESALSQLTSSGLGWQIGASGGAIGMLSAATLGLKANVEGHGRGERTSTDQTRYHQGTDFGLSARGAHDFNQALNYVAHFTKSHHFDEHESQASQLSNQLGADLRQAQTASENREASLSRSERISSAQQFVDTHSEQVSTDMNQAFVKYVKAEVGTQQADALFSNPGELSALHKLEQLSQAFISEQGEDLIANFKPQESLDARYQEAKQHLNFKEAQIAADYHKTASRIQPASSPHLSEAALMMHQGIDQQIANHHNSIEGYGEALQSAQAEIAKHAHDKITTQKDKATDGVIPGHRVDHILEDLHLKNKETEQ